MEMARLRLDVVDIERERKDLQTAGDSWQTIKNLFEQKYRSHSRKDAFSCICCKAPVELVLSQERVCFFRHKDTESCPGSENYKKYTSSRGVENEKKHHVGKAILRDYFEGQLKIHKVEVLYGYFLKQKMQMIPDLVLQFPGGAIWAIDYITGSKSDITYQNFIKKRIDAYNEQGFLSFFLIDQDWYSPHPKDNLISLYRSERQMLRSTEYDLLWKNQVEQLVNVYGQDSLLQLDTSETLSPFSVFTLIYLDINKLAGSLVRCIPIRSLQNTGSWALRLHNPISIPLEQIGSLNEQRTDFRWYSDNESDLRNELKEKCFLNFENIQERLRQEKLQEEQREKEAAQKQRVYDEERARHTYGQFDQVINNERRKVVLNDEVATASDIMLLTTPQDKVEHYRTMLRKCNELYAQGIHTDLRERLDTAQRRIDNIDEAGFNDQDYSSLYSIMEMMKIAFKL